MSDSLDIEIPTFTKHNSHTSYNITVKTHLTSWTVNKRFKSFDKLNHEIIKAVGPAKVATLPVLPVKKPIGNMDDAFIAIRKVELEEYLVGVAHHPSLFRHQALIYFLSKDDATGDDSSLETPRGK